MAVRFPAGGPSAATTRAPDPGASIYATVAVGNQETREKKEEIPVKKKKCPQKRTIGNFFFFEKTKYDASFYYENKKIARDVVSDSAAGRVGAKKIVLKLMP